MPKREVLHAHGLPQHRQPIPTAVKMGQLVFSSALYGEDPETRSIPDDPREQVKHVFAHVRRVMEAAGGTTADIAKVTVYLKDMQYRDLVNEQWLEMFPDEHDRPVRHTVKADLAAGMLVQIEFIAVL